MSLKKPPNGLKMYNVILLFFLSDVLRKKLYFKLEVKNFGLEKLKGKFKMDSKIKMVSFRVSGKLAEELEVMRKKKFINVSELARTLLENYLSNQERRGN